MKLSKIKTKKVDKSFYQDDKISITFKVEGTKIVGVECRNGTKTKIFKVVKDDILKMFKEAEKFMAKIK